MKSWFKLDEFDRNHPSITCIKELNIEDLFSFKNVTKKDVLIMLNKFGSKKAIGIDNISPKIVKDAAEILAKPLTGIINLSINECVFPTKAKIVSVFQKGWWNEKKQLSASECSQYIF